MDARHRQALADRLKVARSGRVSRLLHNPAREVLAIASRLVQRVAPVTFSTPARTFWDDEMEVMLPEPVSLYIFRYGFFEADLTAMLVSRVRPGDVVYDVGAHFGYFSLLASALVGDTGRVFSFEPTPGTYAVLKRNLAGHPNAEAIQAAMSDKRGQATFSDFGVRYSAFNSVLAPRLDAATRDRLKPAKHVVETWNMDRFVEERGKPPTFVKIDAESAELAILSGMTNVLREHRPVVSIEVGDMDVPGAPRSREIVDFMASVGYEPYEFDGRGLVRHEPRTEYRYTNLLFAPAGVSLIDEPQGRAS